jgi:hypothetical protein
MQPKYKFQWYQQIFNNTSKILDEARQVGKQLGLEKVRDRIGLYPGSSSCPGPLPNYVLNAVNAANKIPILPLRKVGDELREVVKDIYGDDYDVATANTCEAGMRVVFDTLFSPPMLRKGDAYRARFITPYGEDYEFPAAYGRPFPPRYKNLFADRTNTGGELGVEAKSLPNLDSIFVRLVGAKYEPHGVKYNPVPLLSQIDHKKSAEKIARVAERHATELAGFTAVGYDTPGYGGNEKDEKGVPLLFKYIGQIAKDFDLPFVVDGAGSAPVFWPHLRDIGASVMLWSTDKAVRAPISGLIVGEEEVMVQIRKALGLGGGRYGEVSSHSKALYSLSDPGRDSLVGLTTLLKMMRDNPEKIKRPIDQMHEIIVEEFSQFRYQRFLPKMFLTKSYPYGGTEVCYEQTWMDGDFGIPIFSMEDMFANTNPIMSALDEMGIFPATIYSGIMFLTPGLGNLDEDDELMEEPTRLAVRALVKATEIVCKYAGLKE